MSSSDCHHTPRVPEHLLRWSHSQTAAQDLAALTQAVRKIKPSPLMNPDALQNNSQQNFGQETAAIGPRRGERLKRIKENSKLSYRLKKRTYAECMKPILKFLIAVSEFLLQLFKTKPCLRSMGSNCPSDTHHL